jgi:hypothetical protein
MRTIISGGELPLVLDLRWLMLSSVALGREKETPETLGFGG